MTGIELCRKKTQEQALNKILKECDGYLTTQEMAIYYVGGADAVKKAREEKRNTVVINGIPRKMTPSLGKVLSELDLKPYDWQWDYYPWEPCSTVAKDVNQQ
ncbi:MAG: hypothetical protein IKZ85_04915 [Pseudobutyrivibrio sp.]|nr:hypothetical protein [Pseudobutyrivibrio sp.]